MRSNSYLGTSGRKSEFAIRSGDLGFLQDRCISTTEWRLLDIFYILVLLRRMTLWPWPLTFWPWVFRVQCFSCPTHIPIFIVLRLSVTESRVLNIWSHFRYRKQSMCMRRVTWPLTGGKNSLHFWTPWPQFAYSLCHFHGATTKIKPCYRRKIAFSHFEGYKVYCACAVSRDLCIGGPPKPLVTIFNPRFAYSLYNFYGATTTIKGSFILEHPMLKWFSAPKMAVFGNLRV